MIFIISGWDGSRVIYFYMWTIYYHNSGKNYVNTVPVTSIPENDYKSPLISIINISCFTYHKNRLNYYRFTFQKDSKIHNK